MWLQFDHITTSYIHQPEFTLESESCKIIWDFGIQTDHLASAKVSGVRDEPFNDISEYAKEIQEQIWLGNKGDQLGIVQENDNLTLVKTFMSINQNLSKTRDEKILWNFKIKTNHPMQARR